MVVVGLEYMLIRACILIGHIWVFILVVLGPMGGQVTCTYLVVAGLAYWGRRGGDGRTGIRGRDRRRLVGVVGGAERRASSESASGGALTVIWKIPSLLFLEKNEESV